MNIGIDANSLSDPRRTGIGRYTESLLRHMLPQGEEHRFFLYSGLPLGAGLRAEFGARARVVLREGRFPSRYLWQQLLLPVHARGDDLDAYLSLDGLLPLGWRAPSVGIVHDLIWHRHPRSASFHIRLVFRLRLRSSVRRARRVIADSEATRDDIAGYAGISPESISVVYPGVPAMFQRPDAGVIAETTVRLGVRSPYILYVGNLMRHKNLAALIRAYVLFSQTEGGIRQDRPGLVIAGAGMRGSTVLATVASAELRDAIQFLGYVEDEALPALYAGAEFLAFPSLMEGFGFPVVEAQACGTPVVCSSAFSLLEVGADSVVFFDPNDTVQMADAMAKVHSDPALREDLRKRGYENVKRFSWEQTAREILNALVSSCGAREPETRPGKGSR